MPTGTLEPRTADRLGSAPSRRHRTLGRRWLLVTTAGEAAGFLLPVLAVLAGADALAPAPRLAVLLLAGAAEGAVLGWAQSSVLVASLPLLSRHDWTVRTALAALVAWALGLGPATWAAGLTDLPPAAVVALAVPAGLVLLGSIGFAQWTVLRRHVPGAARWIGWTALAWIAALAVFTGVTSPLWQPGQGAVAVGLVGALGGLLMAVTMAAVTGTGLRRLLAGAPPPAP